jgi:Putative MetA-pathway of phenol degradation
MLNQNIFLDLPKYFFMKSKISILLIFISNFGVAQTLPSIQTDRPDLTECPFIVPKNYVQMENGFSYQKTDDNSSEIIAPTVLVKYGINDHFELRMISEYILNKQNSNKISGINPILFGFKSRLFEEKGIMPLTSFIGHLSVPKWASSELKTTYFAPEFRFVMQHTISEKQSLSYNLGTEWNGETAEPTFIYTLTTGYSFSEKVSGYIEFYGFVPQFEKPDHRFDGGICYLLNPNHQLDISGGFGLSKNSPNYFVSLGYSFRLKV